LERARAAGGRQALPALGGRGAGLEGSVLTEGILAVVKGIADTGFLAAFANRNDDHHRWAIGVAERVTEPLLTCEPVLAETAFHLRDASLVFEMIAEGLVAPDFDLNDHLPALAALARRYASRQPHLADLCLIRMSEFHPRHSVITIDREDFRIYRRQQAGGHPPDLSSGSVGWLRSGARPPSGCGAACTDGTTPDRSLGSSAHPELVERRSARDGAVPRCPGRIRLGKDSTSGLALGECA
jgi:predicted nucleic acid-binding protein